MSEETKMRRVTMFGADGDPKTFEKKRKIFNQYFIPQLVDNLMGYLQDGQSEAYICLYHEQPVGVLLFQPGPSNSFNLFIDNLHAEPVAFISDAVATMFEKRDANKIRSVFTGAPEFDTEHLMRAGFGCNGNFRKEHLDENGEYQDVLVYELLNPKWNTVFETELNDEDDDFIVVGGHKTVPQTTGQPVPTISKVSSVRDGEPGDVKIVNGKPLSVAIIEDANGNKKDVMAELRAMRKVQHEPVTIPEMENGALVKMDIRSPNAGSSGKYARLENG